MNLAQLAQLETAAPAPPADPGGQHDRDGGTPVCAHPRAIPQRRPPWSAGMSTPTCTQTTRSIVLIFPDSSVIKKKGTVHRPGFCAAFFLVKRQDSGRESAWSRFPLRTCRRSRTRCVSCLGALCYDGRYAAVVVNPGGKRWIDISSERVDLGVFRGHVDRPDSVVVTNAVP